MLCSGPHKFWACTDVTPVYIKIQEPRWGSHSWQGYPRKCAEKGIHRHSTIPTFFSLLPIQQQVSSTSSTVLWLEMYPPGWSRVQKQKQLPQGKVEFQQDSSAGKVREDWRLSSIPRSHVKGEERNATSTMLSFSFKEPKKFSTQIWKDKTDADLKVGAKGRSQWNASLVMKILETNEKHKVAAKINT